MNQTPVNFTYHPYRIILFFTLLAISSMFLLLTIAYFVTSISSNLSQIKIPWLFHLSTLVILMCSYFVHSAYKSMLAEDDLNYQKGVKNTLIFGVIFLVLQGLGWYQMLSAGIQFSNNLSGSYIYAISGLHVLHVAAGIIPLVITFYRIKMRRKDPVKAVVFEVNPVSILKVRLVATYWHFIDALWIYLYVFFIVMVYFLWFMKIVDIVEVMPLVIDY